MEDDPLKQTRDLKAIVRELLNNDEEYNVRELVKKDKETLMILTDLLNDGNPKVRSNALYGISGSILGFDIHGQDIEEYYLEELHEMVAPQVVKLMSDRIPEVRQAAVSAVGALPLPSRAGYEDKGPDLLVEVIPQLTELLSDPDRGVQSSACGALNWSAVYYIDSEKAEQYDPTKALDILERLAAHTHVVNRENVASTIGRFSDRFAGATDRAKALLLNLENDEGGKVREVAHRALLKFDGD